MNAIIIMTDTILMIIITKSITMTIITMVPRGRVTDLAITVRLRPTAHPPTHRHRHTPHLHTLHLHTLHLHTLHLHMLRLHTVTPLRPRAHRQTRAAPVRMRSGS